MKSAADELPEHLQVAYREAIERFAADGTPAFDTLRDLTDLSAKERAAVTEAVTRASNGHQ